MDYSFWFDTMNLGKSIEHLGVSGYKFQIKFYSIAWRTFFNFTNSADPDEMQHNAAFHQGIHCLQKY